MNRVDLLAAACLALAASLLPADASACSYQPFGTTVVTDDTTPECLVVSDTETTPSPDLELEVFNGCDAPVTFSCGVRFRCSDSGLPGLDMPVEVPPGETVALAVPSRDPGGVAWQLGEQGGDVQVIFEEDPESGQGCRDFDARLRRGCAAAPGGSRGVPWFTLGLLTLWGVRRRVGRAAVNRG